MCGGGEMGTVFICARTRELYALDAFAPVDLDIRAIARPVNADGLGPSAEQNRAALNVAVH